MRSAERSAALCAVALVVLGAALIGGDPRAAAAPATTRATSPGVSVLLRPESSVAGFGGIVRVCVALEQGCTDLTGPGTTEVPVGRFVDASKGAVFISQDQTSSSAFADASLIYGSTFRIQQAASPGAIIVAQMVGGDFVKTCGTTAPPSGAAAKGSKTRPQRSDRVVRKLFGGAFRTLQIDGGYASATAQGDGKSTTGVRVEDTCAGTRVTATSSKKKVTVTDLRRGRSSSIVFGTPYLAEAPPLTGTPGVWNAVTPVSLPGFRGDVKFCKQRDSDCETLNGQTLVPIGSHLDTSDGAARVSTTLPNGDPSSTVTYGGPVQLFQEKKAGARLDLKLEGGDFKNTCRRKGSTLRGAGLIPRGVADVIVQSQRSKGKGKTKTKSKLVDASVRGTSYLMEVRCTKTIVRVFSGTVTVFDQVRDRSVPVSAGRSYVVNRPGF